MHKCCSLEVIKQRGEIPIQLLIYQAPFSHTLPGNSNQNEDTFDFEAN